MDQQAINLLWAKKNKITGKYHPLICHLVDSGFAAQALWDKALTTPFKENFSQFINLTIEETRNWIGFITSLHDIGKASPAFQGRFQEKKTALEQYGMQFPPLNTYTQDGHDIVSGWCVEELLLKEARFDLNDAQTIARTIGAHHGYFYNAADYFSHQKTKNLGGEPWYECRREIFNELCKNFQSSRNINLGKLDEFGQSQIVLLTGLIVVSDWLASNEELFQYRDSLDLPIEEYAVTSKKLAAKAIEKTGWKNWMPKGTTMEFSEMFSYVDVSKTICVNEMQKMVAKHTSNITSPYLVIIEAPTGDGKTEAALYLADQTIQKNFLRGIYIAMPSMATSNQMFKRTANFLKSRYPDQLINLQLAHGQALWTKDFQEMKLDSIGLDYGSERSGVAAMTWFLPKKRTLLAPFGVGTVDQALMSILQVKHYFLRLFGLSHKVLIFDEVHAYDMYMSTLFLHLLTWLKSIGCSVIVLSATLPNSTRNKMISAFCGIKTNENNDFYPRLTTADGSGVKNEKLNTERHQEYVLEKIGLSTDEIISYLEKNLIEGGCAAIICNTVKRTQELFSAIEQANIIKRDNADEELILFHARFPYLWRQGIEEKVLELFGKNVQKRPKKGILVATQVIEQSLDLDFDIMVSELAPIDLIIQRAGRLHRHYSHNRPKNLQNAMLCISTPDLENTQNFDSSGYVYDKSILLTTYYLLKEKYEIKLPAETRDMIEFVYGEGYKTQLEPEKYAKIELLEKKMENEQRNEIDIAISKMIPKVGDEGLMYMGKPDLEEDNPEIHRAFQALTRLSSPSINLICLTEQDGKITTLDKNTLIDYSKKPDKAVVKAILHSSVSINDIRIVKFFWQNSMKFHRWQEPAILREYYSVKFINGRCQLDDSITLILDERSGLKLCIKEG